MRSASKDNNAALQVIGFVGAMLVAGMAICSITVLMATTPVGAIINSLIEPKWAWHLSRSTSVVGYVLLTGSVAWGLVLSTRISKEVTPPPLALAIHQFISWLALALGGLHGYLLLFDSYYKFTMANLLVPFAAPYKPGAVGLGVIGMYLMWMTSASFAWRSWLGQKNWRRLHYLTFPAFGLVTLHGFLAGTDSADVGMRLVYLTSVAVVLFLTNYRILVGRTDNTRKRGAIARPQTQP